MKKKILIYNGQLFMGGIEKNVIKIARGLSQRNDVEVEILIKENDPVKNVLVKEIPPNVNCKFIKTEEMVSLREKASKNKKNLLWKIIYAYLRWYERIYMKKWLKKFFQERKDIDIVFDFDMSLGKYLDVIPKPVVGRGSFTLTTKIGKKKKAFVKRLKGYNKIIVICDEMKEEVKKYFSFASDKTFRIYNPLDIEDILKKSKDTTGLTLEEKEMLKEDYLVGVSRLVGGKGRPDLVEIFSKLKKEGIQEKLYLLGEGNERPVLEKMIKDFQLEDQVYLLGQKKNPYIWMKNAKMLVHTSYGEGFCNVLVESMACGTPAMAYGCPIGPTELLGNGKYGWIIKTGDKEEFAETLIEVLRDPNKLSEKREVMEKRVEEFLLPSIVEEFIKIIKM